ncbi:MAG: hypothetical protein K2M48_02765 [Clostridiales bacterium]|nr:hypothetical protein [Clostridiales bacterium]
MRYYLDSIVTLVLHREYLSIMTILETVEKSLGAIGNVFSIGESECGNPILCIHRGSYSGRQLIITAAIHARECYTALVALKQAQEFSSPDGGAYFVPLVNPDGALFFENGETFGRELLINNLEKRHEWKANADGVDLNTNFDARWGSGRYNVNTAGASDYIGKSPLSAKESRALAAFTEKVMPSSAVSYHCMGGELYWEFFQTGAARRRDERIAKAVAEHIGVKKVDGDLQSAGGYKDYCVQKLGIPAITVELIKSGAHPFPPQAYAEDVAKNADLPSYLLNLLNNRSE